MLITSVQSFKLIAWKLWEELITQTCHPILKPNLKIFQVQNAVLLSKMMFLLAKSHMHIFNMLITSVKVSNWLLENSGRSWLHKLATPYWSLTWKFSKYKLKPNLKIVQVQNAVILSKNFFSPEKIHMHIFNISTTYVHGFEIVRGVEYTNSIPYNAKSCLKWLSLKGCNSVKISSSFTKKPTCTSSICPQQICKVSKRSIKNCGRSWLHKLYTVKRDERTDGQTDWRTDRGKS